LAGVLIDVVLTVVVVVAYVIVVLALHGSARSVQWSPYR